MAKKGSLFNLVKSLSKTEKRYFRLFAGSGKAETNYLKLFDAIDRQEHFDEEAIRKLFKGEAFIKQLHVAKIYLSELILKALRNYHTGGSIHGRILDLLRDTEILFVKELYDAALLKIEKAEKLAIRYEKMPLLMEVLQWKRKLTISQSLAGGEISHSILRAEKDAVSRMQDSHFYWNKTHNIFEEVRSKTFLNTLDVKRASTLQSLTLHRHLLYSYYFMGGQAAKAEKEISMLIKHLEKDPQRIEDDPGSYVTAISNKIGLLLSEKRWEETEALINEMRGVPVKYKLTSHSKFTVRLWLRIFNLELEVCRDTKQLTRGVALVREVEAFMAAHKSSMPDNYRIMLCYQAASINFLKGNYSKALKWLNEIINLNFEDTRIELQCYARFLNLMVHFELNNIIVLRYAVDSCRRFLRKKKMFGKFETQILRLFSRLSVSTPSAYQAIFKESSPPILNTYTAELKKLQDYIDLKEWMAAKV